MENECAHTTGKWPFKCEKHSITDAFELYAIAHFALSEKASEWEIKGEAEKERKAPSTDAWKRSQNSSVSSTPNAKAKTFMLSIVFFATSTFYVFNVHIYGWIRCSSLIILISAKKISKFRIHSTLCAARIHHSFHCVSLIEYFVGEMCIKLVKITVNIESISHA